MTGRRSAAAHPVIVAMPDAGRRRRRFIVMLILNAFVLDDYDAYGEVPIPGSTSLQLPAAT